MGYQLCRSDRKENKSGRGVCICIHDGFQAFGIYEKNLMSTDCEQIWISIELEYEYPLIIECIYRAPSPNESTLAQVTDKCVDTVVNLLSDKQYSSVNKMGDFNMPGVERSENGTPVSTNMLSSRTNVTDAKSKSSFIQLITENTFITDQSRSLLDLILVSDSIRASKVGNRQPLVTCSKRSHCSLRFQYISKTASKIPIDNDPKFSCQQMERI